MAAFIRRSSLSLLLLLFLLGHNSAFSHGEKADWIHVGGSVDFDGIPICALVLINIVTQFACYGNGRYDMEVPADADGMITVQVFADGFAPFNQIVTPDQAVAYPVDMRQDQGSPSFNVTTAKRFFRRLLRSHGGEPRKIVTDKLRSYGVAHRELIPESTHSTKQYENNRAEQSHKAIGARKRRTRKFKSVRQAQRFLDTDAVVSNLFNLGRHLVRAEYDRNLRVSAFEECSRAIA
jgi:hypothetical protein